MSDAFDIGDGTNDDSGVMTFECISCGTELAFDAPSICPVCGELTD